jgi:hypothetical protein
MSQGAVLFDALFSVFLEKKKESKREKGEMTRGLFPRTCRPYWLCHTKISTAVGCN